MDHTLTKQHRLILFPLPFQGHINPMFQLANILHSKGFSISIIHTRCNFPDPSAYPHFDFHPIPDGLPESSQFKTRDVVRVINLLNANCIEPFKHCLERILSHDTKSYHVPCIITDAIWYCTQGVADELQIPRVVLRTGSVGSFLAFAALPLFRERGYYMNTDSKLDDPIPEFPPLKVKDIPTIQSDNENDMFITIANTIKATKKSSCLIFNTADFLESPELTTIRAEFHMPTFAIGPFHKRYSAAPASLLPHDATVIAWLNTQPPQSVLYISFGSIASLDQHQLLEVSSGLANANRPFMWSTGNSSPLLPKEFMHEVRDRSRIVKWAPQQEVLAHASIGGFWTHCGWNSTLEGIGEGVAMICSPFFGDQMANARWICDVWRVGIRLENGFERGEIERAVRKLMMVEGNNEGEDMRKRVARLKEAAEGCLNEGGSSYHALEELSKFIKELI